LDEKNVTTTAAAQIAGLNSGGSRDAGPTGGPSTVTSVTSNPISNGANGGPCGGNINGSLLKVKYSFIDVEQRYGLAQVMIEKSLLLLCM
jgi:hypothetical protein